MLKVYESIAFMVSTCIFKALLSCLRRFFLVQAGTICLGFTKNQDHVLQLIYMTKCSAESIKTSIYVSIWR